MARSGWLTLRNRCSSHRWPSWSHLRYGGETSESNSTSQHRLSWHFISANDTSCGSSQEFQSCSCRHCWRRKVNGKSFVMGSRDFPGPKLLWRAFPFPEVAICISNSLHSNASKRLLPKSCCSMSYQFRRGRYNDDYEEEQSSRSAVNRKVDSFSEVEGTLQRSYCLQSVTLFWIYSPSLHLLVEVLRDINRNWSFMLDKEVDINELDIPCTTLVWPWPISSLLSWIR